MVRPERPKCVYLVCRERKNAMKTVMVTAILGCVLVCSSAMAQRGGPPGHGGGAPTHPPGGGAMGPSHRGHPNGGHGFITGLRPERTGLAAGYTPWGWGWGLPGSYFGYGDWGNCGEPTPPTQVIMMPQQPQAPLVPPAPRPEP